MAGSGIAVAIGGTGVGVNVDRDVAVAVAVDAGKGICVRCSEGVDVRTIGVFPLHAERKMAESTINKDVYFMETQLYPQAV